MAEVDLVVKNGWVVAPWGTFYGGVAADKGVITHVTGDASLPSARRVIDAKGQYIIPGLIDPHVHLGYYEPGDFWELFQSHFATETRGAIFGGVTTAIPFLSELESYMHMLDRATECAQENSFIDFSFHAIIGSKFRFEEQEQLWRKGITSFKHYYTAYKGWEGEQLGIPSADDNVLYKSFEFIGKKKYPAVGMLHTEDQDLKWALQDKLRPTNRQDLAVWTETAPGWISSLRTQTALEVAKQTGAAFYVVHMSSREATEVMLAAQRDGWPAYAETCIHYLTRNCLETEALGNWGKVNETLKYPEDVRRLWRAWRQGVITNVGTDHCPYTRDHKEQGKGKYDNMWDSLPGIANGLEDLLPVLMTAGVNAGEITIEDMVRVACLQNAKTFGLYPRKGQLAPGADADIVIVDPEMRQKVDETYYHTRATDWSLYWGWTMQGMARTTIVRGKVMMEDRELVSEKGHGRFIFPPALRGRV